MKRSPSRPVIGKGRWPDKDLPFKIGAAMALRDVVDVWFDGSLMRAAAGLGVSKEALWRQMTGRDVVSRPMVRRLLLLTSDEKGALAARAGSAGGGRSGGGDCPGAPCDRQAGGAGSGAGQWEHRRRDQEKIGSVRLVDAETERANRQIKQDA